MEGWSSPETAERVLIQLDEIADESRRVVCSSRALARRVPETSYTTVLRALARLADEGGIRIVRAGTGRWTPSVIDVLRKPDRRLAEMYAPVA